MSHSLLYSPFFSGDRRPGAPLDGRRPRDLASATDAPQVARDARLPRRADARVAPRVTRAARLPRAVAASIATTCRA
jgi:hypothetical protein